MGNRANRVDQNANVVTSAQYNAYGARGSSNYDDDPYDGFGGQYGYRKDAGGADVYELLILKLNRALEQRQATLRTMNRLKKTVG